MRSSTSTLDTIRPIWLQIVVLLGRYRRPAIVRMEVAEMEPAYIPGEAIEYWSAKNY
jgi:hypothetical protein